ncbi:hypothetical protein EYF80_017180 [Liparis tanakae]|uniref:Uncharacterized protein n=1 Tax=Liparis tanakae TaxID=230148 RepID=A0A4Z2I5R4_9TELE|nr:hypothetical protein EYF80_017180 [Liparis tanakae]
MKRIRSQLNDPPSSAGGVRFNYGDLFSVGRAAIAGGGAACVRRKLFVEHDLQDARRGLKVNPPRPVGAAVSRSRITSGVEDTGLAVCGNATPLLRTAALLPAAGRDASICRERPIAME